MRHNLSSGKEQEFHSVEEAANYIRLLSKPIPKEGIAPLSLYKPKPKELIAGGDPVRIPVDRVAARVVAPAPDWAKAPPPPAQKREKPMNDKAPIAASDKKMSDRISQSGGNTFLVGTKKDADFNVELAGKFEKHFDKNVEDTENLVKRAEEARAAIEYLVNNVKREWVEYDDFIIEALKKARATKVAIEIETKQTLTALGDVRKFFLDPRHEQEVQKLKEFVDICDRLRELKSSGFLDAISDTILRLSM